MITQEQLKEVKDRTEQLNRYLDIDGKKIQYEEEQLRTQAPGFWNDQKRAEAQMKLVKGLEKWLKGYAEVKTLCDELDTAFEFYKEELVTEEEVDALYAKAITAIEELGRRDGRCPQDKLWCWRHRGSGLGTDAHANVHALCRDTRLQVRCQQLARWR